MPRPRSRNARRISVSSALRKRDRSCRLSGGGPPVAAPSSRRCRATSRPASASPILAALHARPFGDSARAPFARQRAASGISLVTQRSPAHALSDPVIRRVRLLPDEHHPHIWQTRRPQRPRAVRYDQHRQTQPGRHPVHLLAHRAGIAIDIDRGQGIAGRAEPAASGADPAQAPTSAPTGHETPVPPSPQYPNGFFARYCW